MASSLLYHEPLSSELGWLIGRDLAAACLHMTNFHYSVPLSPAPCRRVALMEIASLISSLY
jgi:hypothetical protein